jgi:DNA invertase Pin-like site-specific DNA recombinase
MIAQRTREAPQAAKARGKRLGNPYLEKARKRGLKANQENADRFAANVLPVIRQIQESGVESLRGVARALTDGSRGRMVCRAGRGHSSATLRGPQVSV